MLFITARHDVFLILKLLAFEPLNGIGLTAKCGFGLGRTTRRIGDYRQAIFHMNQTGGGIRYAFFARIARYGTEPYRRFARQRIIALHVQILTQRYEFEEIPGAGRDTVGTRHALLGIDLRQPISIHVDGIEGAGDLTVREAETTPGAALAPARNYGRGTTTFEPSILGYLPCLETAAPTTEARDQLLLRTCIDLQILGNQLDIFVTCNRALTGADLPADQLLGKRETPRLAARTTIRSGQHFVGAFDPRILLHFQEPPCDRKDQAKKQTETGHDGRCDESVTHQLKGSARATNSSSPGSFGSNGFPGWIHLAGQISAACTISA